MGFDGAEGEAAVAALQASRAEREKDEAAEAPPATDPNKSIETPPNTDADAGKPAGGAAGGDGSTTDAGSTKPDDKTGTGAAPDAGKGQGDEGAGKPVESIATRVNGVDRTFNLASPQDKADLVRAAQLGLNYERHMADLAEKVKGGVDEALPGAVDAWTEEVGLSVKGPDGASGVTLESLAKFALKTALKIDAKEGLAAFRAALDAAGGSDAPAEDELSAIEQELDPEKDKALLAIIKRNRELEKQVKAVGATAGELKTTLSTKDEEARTADHKALRDKVVAHFDSEVAKFPILGKSTQRLRDTVRLLCIEKENAKTAAKTPEETVSLVLKELADEKIAERAAWEKEKGAVSVAARPKPDASPPATTGAGGVPSPAAAPNTNGKKFASEKDKEAAAVAALRARREARAASGKE